ncbi:leucine-rich repeat protein [Phocaeicola sp.]
MLFVVWMAGVLGMLASCSSDQETGQKQIDTSTVTVIAAVSDGMKARASSATDDVPTRCVMEVRNAADHTLVGEQYIAGSNNGAFAFTIRLDPALTYYFLFWADGGESYYDTSDLTKVTVADVGIIGGIAYSGKIENATSLTELNADLHHVVAKVSFNTTAENLVAGQPVNISLPLHRTYNVATGTVTDQPTVHTATVNAGTYTGATPENPVHVLSLYALAATDELVGVELSHDETTVNLTNVPLKQNYHTVLKGRIGRVGGTFTVTTQKSWGDKEYDWEFMSPIQLGTTPLTAEMLEDYHNTRFAFEGQMSDQDLAVLSEYCKSHEVTVLDMSRCTGITEIPDNAFKETALEIVTLPESITTIGDQVFSYCGSLTSVQLPRSLEKIGYSTFRFCKLKSITLPGSLTQIGNSLFSGCGYLTSVTWGEGITTAGSSLFWGCALTTVTLPESFSIIPDHFFGYCYSLTSITLSANVTEIGEMVFVGCAALSSVTLKGTTPPTIDKTAFDEANANYSIIVPKGCKQTYIDSDKGWDIYAGHIKEALE